MKKYTLNDLLGVWFGGQVGIIFSLCLLGRLPWSLFGSLVLVWVVVGTGAWIVFRNRKEDNDKA